MKVPRIFGQKSPAPAAEVSGEWGEEALLRMTDIFKVLGDPTRLRIVAALLSGELSVSGIAERTGLPQPSVSHHLKILRQLNLARYRRHGRMIVYRLADHHVADLISVAAEHASEPLD